MNIERWWVENRYFFSGVGTIYSFTRVSEPPAGYEEQSPYWIGLIKLKEGPLVTAQLTDFWGDDIPEIGMEVELVTRILRKNGDRGLIVYGNKFRRPM